jgi:hypothetical protein
MHPYLFCITPGDVEKFLRIKLYFRAEDLNKASMLAVACALLEHADAAVVQAESYEGAGPGEIPSLPRLIPKILHSTLQHCVEEGQQGGGAMDCQAGLEKTRFSL